MWRIKRLRDFFFPKRRKKIDLRSADLPEIALATWLPKILPQLLRLSPDEGPLDPGHPRGGGQCHSVESRNLASLGLERHATKRLS
jgi:hypothetical protein